MQVFRYIYALFEQQYEEQFKNISEFYKVIENNPEFADTLAPIYVKQVNSGINVINIGERFVDIFCPRNLGIKENIKENIFNEREKLQKMLEATSKYNKVSKR